MKHLFALMMLILVHANCAADSFEKEAGAINWTGFYAGVSLGAIFNKSLVDTRHVNFIPPAVSYRENLNETDVIPGLHAGYNHQLQSGFVLGGEADFTYPDSTEQFIRVSPNGNLFDEFTVKNRLQGSIRSKLGYAFSNFLPYVTAGVSFADISLRYKNEVPDEYQKDTVQTGWVLGGGLEYALFDKMSVRTEYLYSDYGDPISMQMPTVSSFTDPNGSASADLVSHSVRVALNYRF